MRFALVVVCTCIEQVVDICWFCACADLFWASSIPKAWLHCAQLWHRCCQDHQWSALTLWLYLQLRFHMSAKHFLFCTFCAVYLPGRVRSCWTSGSAVEQVTGAFERRQAETQNGQSMRTLAGAILALEAHGDSKQQPEMHFAYFCLAKHSVQSDHVLTSSENWMWFWLHCCKVCEVAALGLDALWQRALSLWPPWANFVALVTSWCRIFSRITRHTTAEPHLPGVFLCDILASGLSENRFKKWWNIIGRAMVGHGQKFVKRGEARIVMGN